MGEHEESYYVLGCMDRSEAYCIPFDVVKDNLGNLNTTQKADKAYWHVALTLDDGDLKWNISKVGEKLELSPFSLEI